MSSVKFDFTGENFIVTGASSGMGKQVALDLANAGAKVLAIARDEKRLAELKNEYRDKIVTVSADINDFAKISQGIESFVEENGKIKGLVHAAGIYEQVSLRGIDITRAKKMMDISFWSSVELLQLVTKKKISEDKASFVLFSSVSGIHPELGSAVYSSVKAAVNAVTKSVAGEICKRGQRINSVCPGTVKTPMSIDYREGKFLERQYLGLGEAEDVSSAVLYLLSDAAMWITGTNMVIDGGYLAN